MSQHDPVSLSKPWFDARETERIQEALAGKVAGDGPFCRKVEKRLGAQLDGILRSHQRNASGTLRDTAVYSITAAEWPTVREHLDFQLARER